MSSKKRTATKGTKSFCVFCALFIFSPQAGSAQSPAQPNWFRRKRSIDVFRTEIRFRNNVESERNEISRTKLHRGIASREEKRRLFDTPRRSRAHQPHAMHTRTCRWRRHRMVYGRIETNRRALPGDRGLP